jgi:hypothetical protein
MKTIENIIYYKRILINLLMDAKLKLILQII